LAAIAPELSKENSNAKQRVDKKKLVVITDPRSKSVLPENR
jgi:hypothetical protein